MNKINNMDKYNHKDASDFCRELWENQKVYKWNEDESRDTTFITDTPPPTVSGHLHIGHVYSYTQADYVNRFRRMKGENVFYPMGFDDNGLPTEKLVEKVKNVRAKDMIREDFIKLCNEVVKDAEDEFRELFKSISLSVDWSQEYQTISAKSRSISQMSFIDLYNKGLLYRHPQPTLWDIIDQTALAQADIVDKEMPSKMYKVKFKLDSEKDEGVIIATTRPELIAACVAVFFNPEDARYKNLKGKYCYSPIFNVKLPIIPDDKVDIEKGTGLVMCATFGDITDIYWYRTHKLPLRQILSKNGYINLDSVKDLISEENYNEYNGITLKEAKKKIPQDLEDRNIIISSEEGIHVVKCAERSGQPLEILVSEQWSIKVLDYKEKILEKVNQINWRPDYMKNRIETWVNGLQWDWCISRQRYFGVPIPAWYSKRKGEEGKIIIPNIEDLPVDPINDLPRGYSKDEVIPDYDVMDTWATSSVTPQLTSHGIVKGEISLDDNRHSKLYPADLRPQAHEIIRTWAFYTIVKSLYHEDSIPWHNIMISGWCLASDKTKMSKSKGNIITPKNLVDTYGSDVIRYWSANSRLGADIIYSEEMFKNGNRLINKIWNVYKFCKIHFDKFEGIYEENYIQNPIDLWMIKKLNIVIEKYNEAFLEYDYCSAKNYVEDFFWKILCDNYLEIIKVRIYNEDGLDDAGQKSAVCALRIAFDRVLKLFAPIMPDITEVINYFLSEDQNNYKSIHSRGNYAGNVKAVNIDDAIGDNFIAILDEVRKVKAENNLSLKAPLSSISVKSNDELVVEFLNNAIGDLKNVSQSSDINIEYSEETEALNCKIIV